MEKNEVIAISKTYIHILKSEGIQIDKAFLYASYLNNTATKESDIDLMIVTDNDADDYLTGKIWNLTKKVNSRIEPYLVSASRFYNNENSPFIDLVKSTGLEIA